MSRLGKKTEQIFLTLFLTVAMLSVLVVGTAGAAWADDAENDTPEGAITTGEFIDPPETVEWIDKDNLILGVSSESDADWYQVRYRLPDGTIIYSKIEAHNLNETSQGTFQINVREFLEYIESEDGKAIQGAITLKVYAGKGSYDGVTYEDEKKAEGKEISCDNYQSILDKLEYTPTPTDVSLSCNDNNQLYVSLKLGSQEDIDQNLIEFRLVFSMNGKEICHTFCYPRYTRPSNLIWTKSGDTITIPVTDFFREQYLDRSVDTGNSTTLAVKALARYDIRDTEKNQPKYQTSKESTESSISYQKASPVEVRIDSSSFANGVNQKLEVDSVKKLIENAPEGATLELEVKASAPEDTEKADAFKQDAGIAENYSDFSTFEVNLNLVKGDDSTKVDHTASALLITIPIPESLQRRQIVILRNHGGVIEEVGSVVSEDGKMVSFYTDKFSDYAIAVKKDSSETSGEDGSDPSSPEQSVPSTPSDPSVPSEPSAPSSPSVPSTPSAPEVSGIAIEDQSVRLTHDYSETAAADNGKYTFLAVNPVLTPADAESDVTYNIADKDGNVRMKDIKAGRIVALGTAEPKELSSLYLKGSREVQKVNKNALGLAVSKPGIYTITASAGNCSDTAVITVSSNFSDVALTSSFSDAVAWAYDSNITAGVSDDTFGSNESVTRAQFITWLYKEAVAQDSSVAIKDADVKSVFSDVATSKYYAKAVQWAVENKITSGTTATTFSPDQAITRAQAVTLLWNMQGKPDTGAAGSELESTLKFKDMPSNPAFKAAITWAVNHTPTITSGTTTTTFSPDQVCTRAQAVQFLYKTYGV